MIISLCVSNKMFGKARKTITRIRMINKGKFLQQYDEDQGSLFMNMMKQIADVLRLTYVGKFPFQLFLDIQIKLFLLHGHQKQFSLVRKNLIFYLLQFKRVLMIRYIINRPQVDMDMLERYLNTKKESYHWLLSQIQRITQHLKSKTDQMLALEYNTIKEGCQYSSNQEIAAKIGELNKNHHLHLQKVVDMFITSMANLAYTLNTHTFGQQLPKPYTVVEPQPVKIVSQLDHISPIQQPVPIPHPIQNPPKIQIKIPKKVITVPSHSLLANHKPQKMETTKYQSPNTLSTVEAKTQPKGQSSMGYVNTYINQFQLQRASRKAEQQKEEKMVLKEACVKDCLELDHKIYNQANEYLNNVIKSKQRGMSPLKRSFLAGSPITKLA